MSQSHLAPVATAPGSASSAAPVNARVPVVYDLASLFPECSGLPSLKIPGFKDPGNLVPDRDPDFIQERGYVLKMAAFLSSRGTMLTLFGGTGCGKTDRVLDFYSRLNVPVLHDAATEDTRMYHLLGDKDLVAGETKFTPKKLYKAMKFGYPYLIDEVYRLPPSVTSKLHMIRDRGEVSIDETGETLKAKPGFKFIMTANQGGFGDFTGAHSGDNVQDVAFLNGSMVIKCGYPAPEIEERIVAATLWKINPQTPSDVAKKMVAVANAARAVYIGNESNATAERIEIPFSTRTLVMWAEFLLRFRDFSTGVNPLYEALDFVCLDRATPATRAALDGFVLAHFGVSRTDV